MNNKSLLLTTLLTSLTLTACGSSDSSDPVIETPDIPVVEVPEETVIYGPLSTGSVSEPSFAYFDLETMTQLTLTEEEAQTNTQWDIAFKRSDIYLSNVNSDTPVSVYKTDINSISDGTPQTGKVNQFNKITITFELMNIFVYPLRFRML